MAKTNPATARAKPTNTAVNLAAPVLTGDAAKLSEESKDDVTKEGDLPAVSEGVVTVSILGSVTEALEGCELAPFLVPRFVNLHTAAMDVGASQDEHYVASQQFQAVINVLQNADTANFHSAIKGICTMIASNPDWELPVMNRVVVPSVHAPVFWAGLVRLAKGQVANFNYRAATACFDSQEMAVRLANVFEEA